MYLIYPAREYTELLFLHSPHWHGQAHQTLCNPETAKPSPFSPRYEKISSINTHLPLLHSYNRGCHHLFISLLCFGYVKKRKSLRVYTSSSSETSSLDSWSSKIPTRVTSENNLDVSLVRTSLHIKINMCHRWDEMMWSGLF